MKKLKLIKTTLSNLTDEQMNKIKGATYIHNSCWCNDTESCSVYYGCCPPPEKLVQPVNDINV